jgi:hypothetical protein
MSDTQAQPGSGWMLLTSDKQTPIYVRKDQISSYGSTMPGYSGTSWISFIGADSRWYVLETMDEITALINTHVEELPA